MQVLFFSLIIATAIWVVSAGDRLERIQRNSFSYYAADLKNSKQEFNTAVVLFVFQIVLWLIVL